MRGTYILGNVINLAAADNFSGLAQANPWTLRTRSRRVRVLKNHRLPLNLP